MSILCFVSVHRRPRTFPVAVNAHRQRYTLLVVPNDLVGPGRSSGFGTDKDGWRDEIEENESYINKNLLGRSYIAGVKY